jgi:UPF0271 protein
LGFKILDASAFYVGIPFTSESECYTTSLVYDEIKHIKKSQNVLETLRETGRLKIRDPKQEFIKMATNAAQKTGDFQQLSKQDLSVIALCMEISGQIISDDFAVSNVAKNLGLGISPLMTKGIKDVGEWIHYCPACKSNHKIGKECPLCGTHLKRKLIKNG